MIDPDHTFFISDTHFGHGNIIKYCHRPFNSLGDMNETMITAWNAVVGPDDLVIHVGDFCFGTPGYIRSVADRLNGQKRIILGNHDRKPNALKDAGWDVCKSYSVCFDQIKIFLNHRPVFDETKWPAGTDFHFHGHSHSPIGYNHANRRIQDVGVDRMGFVPRTVWEIIPWA